MEQAGSAGAEVSVASAHLHLPPVVSATILLALALPLALLALLTAMVAMAVVSIAPTHSSLPTAQSAATRLVMALDQEVSEVVAVAFIVMA